MNKTRVKFKDGHDVTEGYIDGYTGNYAYVVAGLNIYMVSINNLTVIPEPPCIPVKKSKQTQKNSSQKAESSPASQSE